MQPMWTPSEEAIEQAQLTQFARQAVRKYKLELNTYPEFYQWTVDNPEQFWNEVWDWCGVIASRKGSHRAGRRRQDAGRALVSRGAAQFRREPAAPRRPRRRAGVLGRARLRSGASATPN